MAKTSTLPPIDEWKTAPNRPETRTSSMSQLGQSLHFGRAPFASALPQMSGHDLAAVACRHDRTWPSLFDHFVGGCQQLRWQIEALRLGGFQVRDQLKLCRQ